MPSTRKISASGGISTKVTRSAILDNRPSFKDLLMSDATNATPTPTHMEVTISSSSGTLAGRDLAKATAANTDKVVRTPSDRSPALPSASRMVRASGGSAGTHCGLKKLMSRM